MNSNPVLLKRAPDWRDIARECLTDPNFRVAWGIANIPSELRESLWDSWGWALNNGRQGTFELFAQSPNHGDCSLWAFDRATISEEDAKRIGWADEYRCGLEEEPEDIVRAEAELQAIEANEAEPSGEKAGRLAYIAAHDKAYAADQQRLEAMRYAVYHSDTEIKVRDDDFTGDNVITLWKIRGVPKTFYPTKIAAEVAARAHFPHDNPTVRYSRITFIEVDYDFNFGEEV